MKNITLFKTKIIVALFTIVSGILARTVHLGFTLFFFLSLFFFFFLFIMPITSKAYMTRIKHLQDASGGDVFTD